MAREIKLRISYTLDEIIELDQALHSLINNAGIDTDTAAVTMATRTIHQIECAINAAPNKSLRLTAYQSDLPTHLANEG